MNRSNARARVRQAQMELDAAEQQLAERWQRWRCRFRQHRLSVLIGAGLFGGLAAATVPPKHWARLGAAVFGGAAWLTRSAIGPALLGALWTRVQGSSGRAPAVTTPADSQSTSR